MPYSGPGQRFTLIAARNVQHGKPAVASGHAGIAFKVEQLGPFVDPALAAATQIDAAEAMELDTHGVHEVTREGNLATADVGAAAVSDIYIQETTDTLGLAAQALTGAVLNANWRKFGKVVERDASRTPQVLRVDLDAKEQVRGTLP